MAAPRSFFRDILAVFGTKVVVLLLSLTGIVVLSRSLGAEGQGMFATLLVIPLLLVNLFDGGMRQSATYFLGRKLAPDAEVLGAVALYCLLAGGLGFATVYWALVFKGTGEQLGMVTVLAASAILPAFITVSTVRGYLLGKQQIKRFNTVLWVEKALYVVMLLVLWAMDSLTVLTATLVTAVSACFNAGQALWYLVRSLDHRPRFSPPLMFRMLRIGAVYALALFLITANYKLDILLMGWLSTAAETGKYAIAARIGEMLWELPGAVGLMMFSRSANAAPGAAAWQDTACRAIRTALWTTVLGALAFGLAAPFMVPILFGADFAGSETMLQWLLPGMVLMVVFKLANTDLGGQGKPYIALAIMSLAVPVNIALNILLIPQWGGVGAALASTASYSLSAIIMMVVYARRAERPLVDFLLIRKTDLVDAWAQLRSLLLLFRTRSSRAALER